MIRAILLAAGKGTRMKSARSKVLHEICGRPMLWYVVRALRGAGIHEIVVVVNPELEEQIHRFDVASVLQAEQLGTGHAVRVALERLEPRTGGRIVVACGDMPLVSEAIFSGMIGSLDGQEANEAVMSLVTVKMPLPSKFRARSPARDGRRTHRRSARRDPRRARNRGDECGDLCFRRGRAA